MSHKFEIRKNKRGEYVAYFTYNSETIWWTEGYSSKASAKNAIASILKNGPSCEFVENYDTPKKEIKTMSEDGIKILKEIISSLKYKEMIDLAQGINDKVYTECTTQDLAEGIAEWASS